MTDDAAPSQPSRRAQPPGPPGSAPTKRRASPERRAGMGALAILLLALVAGDPRVILIGVPAAIAFGLDLWAERA